MRARCAETEDATHGHCSSHDNEADSDAKGGEDETAADWEEPLSEFSARVSQCTPLKEC